MKDTLKSIGGKGAGATYLKTKSGREVQAGMGNKTAGVHIGAGYDKKNKSAGVGVSVSLGGKTYNKNVQIGGKKK